MNINVEDRFKDDLTTQEVFDFCAYHLGTMKGRSGILHDDDEFECSYRDPEGNSCAVGYFIKDDEYDPEIEGSNVKGIIDGKFAPARLNPHAGILLELQRVHDDSTLWINRREAMCLELYSIAHRFKLNTSILLHPDMAWNKVTV